MNTVNSDTKLYFIAIIPPDEIASEVTAIKQDFSHRFDTSGALRSPAHITLVPPFKWEVKKQEILVDVLKKFTPSCQPLSLELRNFNSFAPRVIYLDVVPSSVLETLYLSINRWMERKLDITFQHPSRPFRPHMTVAFRDLTKANFHKAWHEYKHKHFEASFEVNNIHLLRHSGRMWEVMRVFP